MKKIYLIGLILLLTSLTVTSAPVTLRQAQGIAMQFLTKARQVKGLHAPTAAKGLSLAYTGQTVGGTTSLYAFNCGKGEGFVIVAGDDRVPEVLGYADHGTYDTTNMPENMRWWIGQWEAQMEYLATHPGLTMSKPRKATKVVEPLLGDIAWDQGSPYNIYCPYISYYDEDEEQEVSGRAPTGCVATALAQVMYFWKYPAASTGSISYTTATAKKDVCADLNTSYDWSVMVPKCTKQDEDTTKHAIAKLMFNIGAALQSDYMPEGTGAYDADVVPVITKFFGYDKGARYVPRNYTPAAVYESMLAREIEQGRPVPYGGVTSKNEGHFFVLDGIDADGLYHVNWGWGGIDNGYFLISSLQPMDQGIGGSASGNDAFKYHQLFIAGMQPDQGGTAETAWNLSYDKVGEISDTYPRDTKVNTTIYGLTNISSTPDTMLCKLYWTLMKSDSTIVWQRLIMADTLGIFDGYSKLKCKLSIPDTIKAGTYQLLPTYTIANDDYSGTHFMNVLAGANKYYTLTLTDEDMQWETEGGPKVSLEAINPDTLIAGKTNKISVTFHNEGGDYLGDLRIQLYVNGKRNVFHNQKTEWRMVAIPGHAVTTVEFNEPLDKELVTDDDYVIRFIGKTEEDEDGFRDDIVLAEGHIAVKGAAKPSVLYVEDELKLLSEMDGVVPPNNIVVEANISNEGSEHNGPFTAFINDEDDWDVIEGVTTNSVVIPSGSSGTTVTLTCAMENAIEGHTYKLSLFNPQTEEYLLPSYNNKVTFVAGEPVNVGITQAATGKGISFDGRQITCPAEQIDLYNVVGQRVATAKGPRLSTRGLPQGSYIARAKTAQGTVTKKICIRQH